MKRLLILLLSFSAVSLHIGAKTKFVTHLSIAGTLYFIQPPKMTACDNSSCSKSMFIDYSHLTNNDSVIIHTTVNTKSATNIPLATITSGTKQIKADVRLLYIEPHKGGYRNRLEMIIPYEDFKDLYLGPNSFRIDFGNGTEFYYREKKWLTIKEDMLQIISLMDISAYSEN